MTQENVFEGTTKSGKEFVIRYPHESDLQAFHTYTNVLSQEKTFLTRQGEQTTLAEDEKIFNAILGDVRNGREVYLTVWIESELAGVASVRLGEMAQNHTSLLNISIGKEFRGEGIGKTLFETLLKEAILRLKGLEIIELGVFANNSVAIKMYESFGFKEYGRLPKGMRHNGEYVDEVYLYKRV